MSWGFTICKLLRAIRSNDRWSSYSLLLGALDRRFVMERCGLDVGIADQTGQRDGVASVGSAILPSADSEQRIPLLG